MVTVDIENAAAEECNPPPFPSSAVLPEIEQSVADEDDDDDDETVDSGEAGRILTCQIYHV